ncbi:MAG: TonB-dependent receptor [Vicingaceae bacterium]
MRNQRILLSLLFIATCNSLFAQLGTIRGKIIDDETGETLIGVNVIVQGTSNGASTDLDGSFSLKVQEGTYTIECSYISYAKLVVSDISVKAGEVTTLGEMRLKPDAILNKEVVITAKRTRNNETAMVTMQKKSANVMDGISSQTFKKVGDGDAGAAIKRVTGVSVEGGKYVYVRGLGDRYTKTTLNGMEVPGLDPDRNSIQLDIFPTNLIDNLTVFKTFTPDLSGDFTGGNVDIVTKDFPDEKTMGASISLGYNPEMNLTSDFLSYESSSADNFGLGANSRDVPFDRNIDLDIGRISQDPQLVSDLTREFDKTMGATRASSFLNTGFGFNVGNQINKNGLTYGYNFSTSYDRKFTYYEGAEFGEYITNRDTNIYELGFDRKDSGDVGIEEVFWSAFASGSVKKGNSSATVSLMHLQNGQKQASLFDGSKSSRVDQSATLKKHVLYYNQRSISNALLTLKHVIPESDIEITFKTAPTLALNREPDFRQTIYEIDQDRTIISGKGNALVQRIYRDLEEISLGNKLDVKKRFKVWNDQESTLKVGAAYNFKDRTFDVLTYQFRENVARSDYKLDPREILEPSNIYDPVTNDRGVYARGFVQPNNNYMANSTNYAFYAMNELPLNEVLKAIYGVRLEQFAIRYTGQRQSVASSEDIFNNDKVLDEFNVLPSVGLIYNFAEETNLRFNFSQTLARPSFKEKSGAVIIDALTGRTFIGNLDLEQTEIDNFDLRLERFYPGGQLVSLSGFYKKFVNPIEIVPFDQTATSSLTPRNSSDAQVFGGELDARKNLSFIKESLRSWSVGANFTYVVSRIDRRDIITPGNDGILGTPDDRSEYQEKVENKRAGESIDEFRQLQGQSPYIVNAYLNYVNDSLGIEANISFNVQGKRLAVVGVGRSPDVFEQPFSSLNFKVSKSLGKESNSNLSLSVSNILNDTREKLYESYRAESEIFSKFSPGQTLSVGYSYNF